MHDHDGNWRWTQWLVALIGAPVLILTLFMKETAEYQDTGIQQCSGRFVLVRRILWTLRAAIFRSLTILTTETIAIAITLYTAYAYAVMFSFFASASYVYSSVYSFDARQVGLSVISVIIGYLLAVVVQIVVDAVLAARTARDARLGGAAPEQRLYTAMVGSVLLPIGLFW